ncbi:MAG TPA: hypothetical protein VMW54_01940 [Terriglobia bacterium]|nr:hypothetical protein [Terriglobia bacterium]
MDHQVQGSAGFTFSLIRNSNLMDQDYNSPIPAERLVSKGKNTPCGGSLSTQASLAANRELGCLCCAPRTRSRLILDINFMDWTKQNFFVIMKV